MKPTGFLVALTLLGPVSGCFENPDLCRAPEHGGAKARSGPFVGGANFSENASGVHVDAWACYDGPPRKTSIDCQFMEWSFGVADDHGNSTDPRPQPMIGCGVWVTRVTEAPARQLSARWDRTLWRLEPGSVDSYSQSPAPPGNYTLFVGIESLGWTYVTHVG